MTEEVLEGQSVRLPVAGEEGGETLAQQLAALLQDQLELLDARRAVDVVEDVALISRCLSISSRAVCNVWMQRRRKVVSMLMVARPRTPVP